ncbi:MAG: GNAT family N-acetyltransferase [Sphingosinicella sp.]
MPASDISLPLRVGRRTLVTLRRRLVRLRLSLDAALGGTAPALPPLGAGEQGWLVTGLPQAMAEALRARNRDHLACVRQAYRRHFARLDIGFDAYWQFFSPRSRSSLKRKQRRFAELAGGAIDVRAYRTVEEIERFHALARPLSARTYQEKRLGAGLPADADSLAAMRALARRDGLRAFLLLLRGRPLAYLYLPAEGDTLVYAFLGYDPDFADFSPGTLLQLEAMRLLMAEGRFHRLDFTEGEGRHKSQFATGDISCVDLLLLRPNLANRLLCLALTAFDATVAAIKRLVRR